MPRILIGENPELDYVNIYFYSEEEPTQKGDYWHYNDEGEIEVWTTIREIVEEVYEEISEESSSESTDNAEIEITNEIIEE